MTSFIFSHYRRDRGGFNDNRSSNRYDDNRSSGYGNNDGGGVFGNKGGYGSYRSMESGSTPARGTGAYVSDAPPIDWGALNKEAVSFCSFTILCVLVISFNRMISLIQFFKNAKTTFFPRNIR